MRARSYFLLAECSETAGEALSRLAGADQAYGAWRLYSVADT
jgi:hypothetical protein